MFLVCITCTRSLIADFPSAACARSVYVTTQSSVQYEVFSHSEASLMRPPRWRQEPRLRAKPTRPVVFPCVEPPYAQAHSYKKPPTLSPLSCNTPCITTFTNKDRISETRYVFGTLSLPHQNLSINKDRLNGINNMVSVAVVGDRSSNCAGASSGGGGAL